MGRGYTYGSTFSGLEMAYQALEPIGFDCQFVADIEAFPCGIMAHRIGATAPKRVLDPETLPTEKLRKEWRNNNREIERMVARGEFGDRIVNYGDFSQITADELPVVDLLVGGPPCQDFSNAGKRAGLDGHRGALTLSYVELVHALFATKSLRAALYENVIGLLTDKSNAFGCFLGALVGHDAPIVSPHGKGRWTDAGMVDGPIARAAWRVLDAQHFRLAQRRRRLFVVICPRGGADPARILFEPEGVLGPAAPGGSSTEDAAQDAAPGAAMGRTSPGSEHIGRRDRLAFGGNNTGGPIDLATAQTAQTAHGGPHGRLDFASETFVVEPVEVAPTIAGGGRGGRGGYSLDDIPLTPVPLAFAVAGHGGYAEHAEHAEHAGTLRANGGDVGAGSETIVAYPAATAATIDANYGRLQGVSGQDCGHGHSHLVPIAFNSRENLVSSTKVFGALGASHPQAQAQAVAYVPELSPTLKADGHDGSEDGSGRRALVVHSEAVAFSVRGRDGEAQIEPEAGHLAPALRTGNGGSSKSFVATVHDAIRWAVRRLMPTECETLQGSAKNWTRIPWRGRPAEECPDGPRYKAIGNSFPMPVIRWLGVRIKAEFERIDSINQAAA